MHKQIKTYKEAIHIIEEFGLLPLAPLIPDYPSLGSITAKEVWHSDTEFDPWMWRTQFSMDGTAGYGKFIKKKSVLISRELLPYFKRVLGEEDSVEQRFADGKLSREALVVFQLIQEEQGIDTRVLRKKSGLIQKEQKKVFENALLELQGYMDIVIAGIQEKTDEHGEKNGWNSTAFETYDAWTIRNGIQKLGHSRQESKDYLIAHFENKCNENAMKKIIKILQ
ncbi:hypothetical protein [Psychrobacillus sp. BL-248-WT-3]|uniref:AlkZ-related protein n=1 Tax=Psychrobacillus sp. BL-248-WT-3 TaxID=2725306 RepID=UPI00146CBAA3|nr:hypothetical protein [Psychrobacillus sp. BL-248-WT-3]NME04932.1 hypothetical protein [Psychrobacillus sp. BL-248-WT-3]